MDPRPAVRNATNASRAGARHRAERNCSRGEHRPEWPAVWNARRSFTISLSDEQRMEIGDTATLVRGRHLIRAGARSALCMTASRPLAMLLAPFATTRTTSRATLAASSTSSPTRPSTRTPRRTAAAKDLRSGPPVLLPQLYPELRRAGRFLRHPGLGGFCRRHLAPLAGPHGPRRSTLRIPAPAVPQHPNATLDAVFGTRGATSIFPEDRNNFAPRISASFELFGHGRGLVKLGYGIFFWPSPRGYDRRGSLRHRPCVLDHQDPHSAIG